MSKLLAVLSNNARSQFVEEDANSGDNAAHRTCARNRFAKLSTQTRAGKKRLRNDERTSAVETGKHLANSDPELVV
jgi:hypothetical protein